MSLKKRSDLIIRNRMDDELNDTVNKVYYRDLLGDKL